ncbi:MAG: terminase small subunit [Clostridium sp.]|jgi:phage terminase small subunit|nr:terminase small subunit [Clostridium sp.]
MKLTEKQKIFVNEYLVDLNATRAYKVAYPNVKKDDTAAVNGNRLLRNAKVKEYLDERMREREKRTEITQDKVLEELAAIAFSNGSKYAKVIEEIVYDENGEVLLDHNGNIVKQKVVELVLTDELSETDKKAIASIKRGKNGIEISTCDKVRALELLGKHLGMFKEKVEVSGNINNPYEELTTEQLLKIASDKDG